VEGRVEVVVGRVFPVITRLTRRVRVERGVRVERVTTEVVLVAGVVARICRAVRAVRRLRVVGRTPPRGVLVVVEPMLRDRRRVSAPMVVGRVPVRDEP
jgi:hypothetical protein